MTEPERLRLHHDARAIFHQAVHASSIPAAFARRFREPVGQYKGIYAVAIGKAALPMLEALRVRVTLTGGICCAPSLPAEQLPGFAYFVGGHPLPNEDSFRSARAALHMLRRLGPGDLVYFLISGGGSAMFELPLDAGVSLAETRLRYQALVGSGATIAEINTVRKHYSAVKGGRLAAAAGAAARCSLLVSDVPPGSLDALASGLTLQDSSTVEQCREILDRYRLRDHFPPAAIEAAPPLNNAPVEVLLSSEDLLDAARTAAQNLGYAMVTDNSCDDWDYADAARYLLGRNSCVLSGGEVTVRLGPQPGMGGRNQQFALACALQLAGNTQPTVILSAGSDGIDGNSPAAGAIADATTVARARSLGIEAAEALARFDAYPLFTALGDALLTGPTHNNLRDLRILLLPSTAKSPPKNKSAHIVSDMGARSKL